MSSTTSDFKIGDLVEVIQGVHTGKRFIIIDLINNSTNDCACGVIGTEKIEVPLHQLQKFTDQRAKTESFNCEARQVPWELIEQVGNVFAEGMKKYSEGNWRKGVGDEEYQNERLNHAIRHLMLYANGDRSENHLAKVGWFVGTQLWIEAQEKKNEILHSE